MVIPDDVEKFFRKAPLHPDGVSDFLVVDAELLPLHLIDGLSFETASFRMAA